MIHRTLVWGGLLVAVMAAGCAPVPGPLGADSNPGWPYANVQFVDHVPETLFGRSLFTGRWMATEPGGEAAYTEVDGRRFLCRIPFTDRGRLQFIDLGVGAVTEGIGFLDEGRELVLLSALTSPHHADAVLVRSILRIDLEGRLLLDTISLNRSGITRGFALDPYSRRIFLLEDRGGGEGVIQMVEIYRGRRTRQVEVGSVPALVGRKGLVVDRDRRTLFCLSGGRNSRSDFEPVRPGAPEGPALVVLDTDSLGVQARVPLDENFEPRAIAYDGDRGRVYVLEVDRRGSRLVSVDAVFHTVRGHVDLPEETTDLVVSGGYAFAPGANGIYIVELDTETWISRPTLPFDLTEEIAVSGDLATAFVLFQALREGGGPGLAAVALQSGTLLDVLQ